VTSVTPRTAFQWLPRIAFNGKVKIGFWSFRMFVTNCFAEMGASSPCGAVDASGSGSCAALAAEPRMKARTMTRALTICVSSFGKRNAHAGVQCLVIYSR